MINKLNITIEYLLLWIGRYLMRLGYRHRVINTRASYYRVPKTILTKEQDNIFKDAIKQIREWRDQDLMAGVGSFYGKRING